MTKPTEKTVEAKAQMEALIDHVRRFKPPFSPLMTEVAQALVQAASNCRGSYRWTEADDLASRIFRHTETTQWATRPDGSCTRPLVQLSTGEWHVTNADLEVWRDLCFFGKRDYFPGRWTAFASEIGEAIHNARLCQTWERYNANGGLNAEHRKLAARLSWEVNLSRGDGVSLYVQGKRPFGDSAIDGSIARILGWPIPENEDGDFEMTAELTERAWERFDELQFAMPDLLADEG